MNILQKWEQLALTYCIENNINKECLELIKYIKSLTADMPLQRHEIQKALIDEIELNGGSCELRYRGLARTLGEIYPEKIKYHLLILQKEGEISIDFKNKIIKRK